MKGGKSGLHRARSCRKAGRGNPTDRATEKRLPVLIGVCRLLKAEKPIQTGTGETVG